MVSPGDEDTASDNVTAVNTLFDKWFKSSGHFSKEIGAWGRKRPKVPKIDARDLIDGYKAYERGTGISLETIQLQKLGAMAKRSDRTAVRMGRNCGCHL